MKKLSLFFVAISLILISSESYSQNYYICDATGSDDNDGLTENTALKTFDKAINLFNSINGGDKVLFCKGSTFPIINDKRIYNVNCSATNPCTLDAYGDDSDENPIFYVSSRLTALNFTNGGSAKEDGGYVIKNLTLFSEEGGRNGVFLYNDVDDVVIDGLHIEGFEHGVYSGQGSWELDGNANAMNDRIILKNSVIMNNSLQGWLGSCNDCLIENNHFENNGFYRHLKYHNLYLTSAQDRYIAQNVTIKNNTFYKSAIIDGQCKGVSVVVHGKYKNLNIENNVVKEDLGKVSGYCWGISVDPGYAKEEAFYNVRINNNTLINVGNIAIGCASCSGVNIEENTIIDEGQVLRAGIKVPVREEDSVKSKDVVISNNKVVFDNAGGVGIDVGGDHISKVLGNTIYQPINSEYDCINAHSANVGIDISSNNCKKHNGVELQTLVLSSSDDSKNAEDITEPASETSEDVNSQVEESDEIVDNSVSLPNRQSTSQNRFINLNRNNTSNDGLNAESDDLNNVTTQRFGANSASSGSTSSSTSRSSIENKSPASLEGNNAAILPSRTSTLPSAVSIVSDDRSSITTDVPSTTSTPSYPKSSIKSVTVKEVIRAGREDNASIEPSTCRAYSRGQCLMR